MSERIAKPDRPLIALVGPTAVGKTDLSLTLAGRLQGEIVSADSRLFYRGMDIGTAKPSPEEMQQVPHHLIDLVDPDQTVTLADYQSLAYQAIDAIHARGHVPILVGGTGQYVKAVLEGWGIPRVPPSPGLRAELEADAAQHGADHLHQRLVELDPVAAGRIDPRNVRRVIRALEVTLLAGRPISELQTKKPPPYTILRVGLIRSRESLYERIDARIDQMLEMGLVAEVAGLLKAGYSLKLPAMSALGYRQIGRYLQGESSLADAVQLIRKETRRFVRQQSTWFRVDDPALTWFDLDAVAVLEIVEWVSEWLLG